MLTEAMMALYEKVGGIYGYHRLTLHICRETQQRINHKRIQRLMKLKRHSVGDSQKSKEICIVNSSARG
ncbi:transposase [Paenibacillus larvae]|uniref:transposase n=1 Tax=Paenibacillus larvae TaxID=1464 RepID=UPI003AF6DC52